MRSDESRKIPNYGVLCGLGAKDDAGSDSSRSPSPDQENQLPPLSTPRKRPMDNSEKSQPRPQSLTLPFDNRQRESHLVTEEEFDRIIRQEEMANPLPPMSRGTNSVRPQVQMRRSISTARRTVMTGRPRPMSADFSTLLTMQSHNTGPERASMSRDPTLTALPRPPTKNDLAVYPDRPSQKELKSLRQRALTSATTASAATELHSSPLKNGQNKHKRHLSAALMFENARKRLRMGSDASTIPLMTNPDNSNTSTGPFSGHPVVRPGSERSLQPDTAGRRSTDTEMQVQIDSDPISTTPTSSLKKSVLQRTWSKAKHHASKLTESSKPSPISKPLIDSTERPSTSLSYRTTNSTTASTGTSQYYASAEHSPTNPAYEYVSGPVPRKPLLNKLGAPPSKSQLNTIVSRQQSRIQDLTLQNNVLVNQIALLRDEVQGLKVGNHKEDSGNEAGSERTLRNRGSRMMDVSKAQAVEQYDIPDADGRHTLVRRRGNRIERDISGGTIGSQLRRDPNGWRHIMGASMDIDDEEQVRYGDDDRRKTWMTCDS